MEELQYIKAHKVKFTLSCMVIFFVSFLFLASFGLVPKNTDDAVEVTTDSLVKTSGVANAAEINGTNKGENPVRVVIPKINVDSVVLSPAADDIATLDNALLKGVVHYPGSALLGADGNVFLFGHSTSLKNVRNPAYKVFSRLREMNVSDEIIVESEGRAYVYKVTSFELLNDSEALIEFTSTKKKLTLSTCNTFGGKKQERFVVEADFVKSYPLPNGV